MQRYIWSITNDQSIRVNEIREFKIEFNTDVTSFFVTAHGYGFGKGVNVFNSTDKTACIAFVNDLTIPILRKDGGIGDDV